MRAWTEAKWREALRQPGLVWVLVLWPLAMVYGLVWRVLRWHAGLRQPARVPGLRVISVGNLSVGGTGKTPLTLALLKRLAAKPGVAVLSRGYTAAPGPRPLLVSKGAGPLVPASLSGDEPQLFALRSRRVAVLIDPDRERGANFAVKVLGVKTLILDDGFQRRRSLARDLDILLLDYQELNGSRSLLPAGPWREPLGEARDADSLVISRAPRELSLSQLKASLPPALRGKPLFRMDLRPSKLFEAASGKALPLGRLRHAHMAAFSGIARPADFEASLKALGARLDASLRLGDHGAMGQTALARLAWLAPRAKAWVCTEKDWARLDPNMRPLRPIWVLAVEATISPASNFWRHIAVVLKNKAKGTA